MATKVLLRFVSLVLILALLRFAGIQAWTAHGAAHAQDASISGPDKNGPRLEETITTAGSFEAVSPESSSKNAAVPSSASTGEAEAIQPAEGAKNYHANPDRSAISMGGGAAAGLWALPVIGQGPGQAEGIDSDKNGSQPTEAGVAPGPFDANPPNSLSKNYGSAAAVGLPAEEQEFISLDSESKNVEGWSTAGSLSSDLAVTLAATGSLITCGASGNLDWTTTSAAFSVMRQCSMTVPQAGYVFISADGSLARQNGEYEAQFEIGIDSTAGDANIDRWVNVYNDSGDGSDESVALSVLKPIGAGSHTFYFLGKRYAGSGTTLVYDPTLTVIYVPAASATALSCGASGNLDWTTTSSSFAVVRQCNLAVPQAGWVFISADGSLARQNGEYEAQFEIGIDSTAGDANIDRWVNVYDDSGDGSDRSVALSVLKPIGAGSHTFYFLGKRYAGSGTTLVYDPTLTVIYVPAASATALSCGASGNLDWTTTSSSFAVVRQCNLAVPQAGWLFISANGSLARQNGEYEAQFEIGIDSTAGDANIDRWVNVYNDSGDGSDKSVALSVLKNVSAGSHTFYFLGKRYAGSGTVLVYDPTLSVIWPGIMPSSQIFLPLIRR